MPGDIFDNRGRGNAGWSWPSIHPEGRKFGAIAGGIALIAAIFGGSIVAWPFVFLTLGVLAFFRDPVRVTPRDDRFVVAPADGLITLIQKVAPPRELSADDHARRGGDACPRGADNRRGSCTTRSISWAARRA